MAARIPERSKRDPKGVALIEERRLANGLRVLIVEKHDDPVVAVLLLYKVGARDESEREAGISHFLEHMMFKGSRRFGKGAVDLATTVLGGNNNAYTGYDHTAYWFELASDRWEKALEIEADRMRGLLLDATEFEAEKAVVLEELAMGEDDPWRKVSQEVQALLFPRHPYRRPVIGYADTLRAMSVEDMRAYYRRFYQPGNALLVICGDVSPSAALRAARTHFGSIPALAPHARVEAYRPPILEPDAERRVTTWWDDNTRRLCMAWPTVPVGTREDFALDLLSVVLGGGRLARLHRRLVIEEKLATSVSTSNDSRVEGGVFWLFVECRGAVEPRRVEQVIDEELAALAHRSVPASELARARRMLESSEAYEVETVSDFAEDLGEWAIDCDWRLFVEARARLSKIRSRELREVARRLLAPSRRVVGWSMPLAERPGKSAARNGRA